MLWFRMQKSKVGFIRKNTFLEMHTVLCATFLLIEGTTYERNIHNIEQKSVLKG